MIAGLEDKVIQYQGDDIYAALISKYITCNLWDNATCQAQIIIYDYYYV